MNERDILSDICS